MPHEEKLIKCWDRFQCQKPECPAYKSKDLRCWLLGSSYCNDNVDGSWLEKMEICMKCEVLIENFKDEDWAPTFLEISRQFEDYKSHVEEKQKYLVSSQKKLQQFKTTSIYLLRELDKKSQEVQLERDNLEHRIQARTKELHKAQSRLIQSTKMAAIGRFSAGIAHEINNPLGAIINFSRTLLGNPELKGQNRGYLEMILKGLFRIENIVKQILSYSRKSDSAPQMTDINQVIHESVSYAQHKIDEKAISLDLQLMDSLPEVLIDPLQIQQVFNNIFNNAFYAMKKNGKLVIETSVTKHHVKIKVIDNGDGIDKNDLENLCDPFYTTKEVGKGTGLGLFICYNILQINDGNLEIKSKKGEGTRVIIRLPVPKND